MLKSKATEEASKKAAGKARNRLRKPSGTPMRTEKEERNDGKEKRSHGTHYTVCAANPSRVRKLAEIDGGSSFGQPVASFETIRRGELSRSASRPEQSQVLREMSRLTSSNGGAERCETEWLGSQAAGEVRVRGSIGVLAETPRRSRGRDGIQALAAPCRAPRTHRHLHRYPTSLGEGLKSEGRLRKPEILPFLRSSSSVLTSGVSPTGPALSESNHAWMLSLVSIASSDMTSCYNRAQSVAACLITNVQSRAIAA